MRPVSFVLIAGFKSISRLTLAVLDFFTKEFRKPKVREIASTFCAEAAVLIAVFPVLDTIIENRRTQGDVPNVTWHMVAWNFAIVVIFLLVAIIIADRGE